jgi:hypothetical protein
MNTHTILDYLKEEVSRLDAAITALEGSSSRRGRPPKSASSKRTMSPAARKRISATMKLRWAQRQRKSPKKAAAPAEKSVARKPMSPAMKKKMSALMKARWAAKKKAGATSL